MAKIPYLYQLQDTNYNYLNNLEFKVAVVDVDDAEMTTQQVNDIESTGKVLFSYVSIGEAEDYRDYWTEGNWGDDKPDFLLAENPDWEGNYNVKFWDADWQQVIFDRIQNVIENGYSGAYLDIVDGYDVAQVVNAYDGTDIKQDMVDFIKAISEFAKSIDPNFKIIPQNATELLHEAGYLDAIDGIGVEDTWFDGNSTVDWTQYNLEDLALATEAGKFVLSIDYPTDPAKQQEFIDSAIQEGFIPFASDRDLTGDIPDANYDILSKLPDNWFDIFSGTTTDSGGTDDGSTDTGSTDGGTDNGGDDGGTLDDVVELYGNGSNNTLEGGNNNDYLTGKSGHDKLTGFEGDDELIGGRGRDTLDGGDGDDYLVGNRGSDNLDGGAGDDYLAGGGGSDTLNGGEGNDDLIGGGGKDHFVFTGDVGYDYISDFKGAGSRDVDKIIFSSDIFGNVDEILDNIDYFEGSAYIDLGSHGEIEIAGIRNGKFTADDFDII